MLGRAQWGLLCYSPALLLPVNSAGESSLDLPDMSIGTHWEAQLVSKTQKSGDDLFIPLDSNSVIGISCFCRGGNCLKEMSYIGRNQSE